MNQGYQAGFREGQRARQNGGRSNRSYRGGNGQNGRYQQYFQEGFKRGYEDGYNSNSRYNSGGSRTQRVLGSIFNH
jgi:hypothetical protein